MATSLKELIVTYQANAKPVLSALNKIDNKLKETTRNLRTTGQAISSAGREIGLALSLPLAALGGASIKAVADIQSLEASLSSVLKKFETGLPIQEAINEEMRFLKQTADEFGVSLTTIQRPYVQYLASSNDNLQVTRKTIKSFLGLSTALGLTGPQTELVVKALSQMQSKGRVASEELRQQLGDNVPGAVQLFAEAAGKTVPEFQRMMEAGEVSADILAKVADVIEVKYNAAIEKGAKGIRANTNRIANAFFMLRAEVGKGIDETFNVNERMAKFADWLLKVAENFGRLDAKGKSFILTIGALLVVVAPLLIALGTLIKILGIAGAGFLFLVRPLKWLITGLPIIIAGFRFLFALMAANPLSAFILATSAIILNWQKIVDLFESAFNWISKISFSGLFDKVTNFVGDLGFDFNGGARDAMSTTNQNNNSTTNNKTVNNNLTVNIPEGATASDANSIKSAIKQALAEENRQTYIELGAQ
jgi:tape measure domain-containing protein